MKGHAPPILSLSNGSCPKRLVADPPSYDYGVCDADQQSHEQLVFWDWTRNQTRLVVDLQDHHSRVLAFAVDGKSLLSISSQNDVQIRDPRDGVDKLMEVNPRFPRQLWNRTELGINEPLMCVQLARGEPVTPVDGYPEGVLFVSPIEDAGWTGDEENV